MNAWLMLSIAIVLEVAGTTLLKLSNGFSKPLISASLLACYALSLFLMSRATLVIPISLTYPIWSGVGTLLVCVIGVSLFGEILDLKRIVFIALIVIGVIGLKIT